MMAKRVEIDVGENSPVQLDFESRKWSGVHEFAEGDFPLIGILGERRYELYSDGTFDEEDLARRENTAAH